MLRVEQPCPPVVTRLVLEAHHIGLERGDFLLRFDEGVSLLIPAFFPSGLVPSEEVDASTFRKLRFKECGVGPAQEPRPMLGGRRRHHAACSRELEVHALQRYSNRAAGLLEKDPSPCAH